jgi:probable rRNA maturation factor
LKTQDKIFVNFDLVNKKWDKLMAYGLSYEAINITLKKCKIINSEITIRLTNDKEMLFLNKKWRNKNRTTNVLAFPNKSLLLDKKPIYLGDILISYGELKKESLMRNISLMDHMIHLIVHGVLHLCGYDHFNKKPFTNHPQSCFSSKVTFKNKKNGRDAGHRSPDWGCTKTLVFNKNL